MNIGNIGSRIWCSVMLDDFRTAVLPSSSSDQNQTTPVPSTSNSTKSTSTSNHTDSGSLPNSRILSSSSSSSTSSVQTFHSINPHLNVNLFPVQIQNPIVPHLSTSTSSSTLPSTSTTSTSNDLATALADILNPAPLPVTNPILIPPPALSVNPQFTPLTSSKEKQFKPRPQPPLQRLGSLVDRLWKNKNPDSECPTPAKKARKSGDSSKVIPDALAPFEALKADKAPEALEDSEVTPEPEVSIPAVYFGEGAVAKQKTNEADSEIQKGEVSAKKEKIHFNYSRIVEEMMATLSRKNLVQGVKVSVNLFIIYVSVNKVNMPSLKICIDCVFDMKMNHRFLQCKLNLRGIRQNIQSRDKSIR